MIFIIVLLPAPFSPTRPWISPARSPKSTSRSAWTPPNDFEIPTSSSRDSPELMTTRSGSDQEVILHPLHSGSVGLRDHRAVGDDVLRDALARLLAGRDRRDA